MKETLIVEGLRTSYRALRTPERSRSCASLHGMTFYPLEVLSQDGKCLEVRDMVMLDFIETLDSDLD